MEVPEGLKKRRLGPEGPEVSAISLGLMSVGGGITYYEEETMRDAAEEMVARFLDMGGNHIDTSDIYGPCKSEVFLGEMMRKHGREKFFVATKCTLASFLSEKEEFRKWGAPCADPAYVKEACEQSLKRLGTDCIDLFYLHRPDPKTPVEESMKALLELREAGKIKYVGLSEFKPEEVRKAHKVMPVTALQYEWSCMARDLEEDIVPLCKELGIGLVAYSPLARGMLTNAFPTRADLPNDWRTAPEDAAGGFGTCGRMLPGNYDKNMALVKEFSKIADSKNCTPGQLALAWLLAQYPYVVPIPATTKAHRVEENLKAAMVKLTPDDLAKIAEALPADGVVGARYTSPSMTYNGK